MREEDPGFGTISGNSFPIRQTTVTPIPVSGLTAADIKQMFSWLPEASLVSESGKAHMTASGVLADIADNLIQHVQVLNDNWGGQAAQAAVTNFQQLHETALGLAQTSAQTGAVLNWIGEILPAYQGYNAPNTSAGNKAAQAAMQQFNENLVEANGNLPKTVTKNLPTGSAGENSQNIIGSVGGVRAGAAAGAASPGGGTGGVSPGGGSPGGAKPTLPGGPGGVTGVAPGSGSTGTSPTTHLAGLPPGGGGSVPGTGTGTPGTPGAPVGSTPGGSTGLGAPDPVGPVPVPSATAPGDPGDPGGLGGVPGDGTDPSALGGVPGDGDPVPVGNLTGDPGDPSGLGGVPGDGGDPLPVGNMSGGPGVPGEAGDPVGGAGTSPGGQGLVGEDVTGDPSDGAVVGPDGMIGSGPGELGEGMDGGFAGGGMEAGNSGATGFVGADDAIAGPATDPGDGMPMSGGAGGGQQDKERRRQSWMTEDADLWEGNAEHVPSHIGS
jgi:uncharacterized protein YukE